MKIPYLIFFTAALLSISATLHAAQAPKLETLLGEYKKARTDVLSKLNETYASQADAVAQKYDAVSNLDGADRARQFARRLRDPDANNDGVGASEPGAATDPLAILQANYAGARAENLKIVYTFYSTSAENLRRELLKENDQAGAGVLTTFLEKIKPTRATPTAKPTPARKTKKPGN